MRYYLLVLTFIYPFELFAKDSFNLNILTTFVPSSNTQIEGVEHTLPSFYEFGTGISYHSDLSEFWRKSYGIGLTVSKQHFKSLNSKLVYSGYVNIYFEYQQFDDSIKPFLGVQFQKTLSSGNTPHYSDKLKKTFGVNFYPTVQDYTISFAINHLD